MYEVLVWCVSMYLISLALYSFGLNLKGRDLKESVSLLPAEALNMQLAFMCHLST